MTTDDVDDRFAMRLAAAWLTVVDWRHDSASVWLRWSKRLLKEVVTGRGDGFE